MGFQRVQGDLVRVNPPTWIIHLKSDFKYQQTKLNENARRPSASSVVAGFVASNLVCPRKYFLLQFENRRTNPLSFIFILYPIRTPSVWVVRTLLT